MSSHQRKCIIDTNVPITANIIDPDDIPVKCIKACIEAIHRITQKGGLVMDDADEIFTEYRHHLSMKGQPGVGDGFMKWVHDNRWNIEKIERVKITRNGESYNEFPKHTGLEAFDISDRKFVAVANAHPKKPPILQATDSKWWGWGKSLAEAGVTVSFLCQEYVEEKYRRKIGS